MDTSFINSATVTDTSFLLPIIAKELTQKQKMTSVMFADTGMGPVKFVPTKKPQIELRGLWRAVACDLKATKIVIATREQNAEGGTETLTLSIEDQPNHRVEVRCAVIRDARGPLLGFGLSTISYSGFQTKNILFTPECAKKMEDSSAEAVMNHDAYKDIIKLSTGHPIV